jgi:hypothetical protein
MRVQLVKTRRVGLALVMMSLWTVLASSQAQAGINEWTSNGPGAGVISAFAIDPVTPTTLYAGTNGARELPVRPSAGRVGHAVPWGRCVNHV